MFYNHLAFFKPKALLFILGAGLLFLNCQPREKEQKRGTEKEGITSKSLLNPEQLQQYIPAPLEGFQLADHRRNIDTSTGVEISNLSLVFRNEAEETIILSIQDYLNHPEFYSIANSLWNDEMAFEREGSYARTMELPDGQQGWISFDADARQGTMMIGVHQRFLASVRAEQLSDMTALTEWMQSGWLSTLP
jgi:hypothetical protein